MKFNRFLRLLQDEAGDGSGASSDGGNGTDSNPADTGGTGDGLLAGKYKTQADLITGYTELNTSFSAKDEAHKAEMLGLQSPEAYEAGEEWGSDNAMDNRMMSVFQEVGKEHNLTQGAYEALVNGMTEMQTRVHETEMAEIVKSIPNYDNRALAMQDTVLKYLRPDQAQAMDTLMQSKESFEAVELLMGNLRGMGLPTNVNPAQPNDEATLRKELNALNPADGKERARLINEINSRSQGEGTLV